MENALGELTIREFLTILTQTQPWREKLPPGIPTATGIEDEVFLYVLSIGDLEETHTILIGLMEPITVGEFKGITTCLAQTGGLVYKSLSLEEAQLIKERLEAIGTKVVLVRPEEAVAKWGIGE